MKKITNISILLEVKEELMRFNKKLNKAIIEQRDNKNDYYGSNKNYAAVKRSALDLKNELSKLTQDSKYKYDENYLK